jgi:hypothetical protein
MDMNFGFLPSSSPSSSSSSSGKRLSFEMHLAGLQEPAKGIMADLRKFVLSLGPNVIEEVRPHRIVYAKTLTFRTFLSVEPSKDRIIIEVKAITTTPTPTKSETSSSAESVTTATSRPAATTTAPAPPSSLSLTRFVIETQEQAELVKEAIAEVYKKIR